jgi:phospholipid/cholesterol/gamma-HCH transport system permease protein
MAQNENKAGAEFHIDGDTLFCQGDWIAPRLHAAESGLSRLQLPASQHALFMDMSGIRSLDTAGAWLVHRTRRRLVAAGHSVQIVSASAKSLSLLALVDRDTKAVSTGTSRPSLLEEAGRYSLRQTREAIDFLAFAGELGATFATTVMHPARMRWNMLWHNLEGAGFRALPIVGLLSFLLGIVISYQGGVQLMKYGANLYISDLVGISMLRELAPLMTAIIVAGRTGSAFTAQIGTMKVTDEIDALRTMGIQPMEQLVLPKVLALVIALPLLTVYADVMGLVGGAVIANTVLDVSPTSFIERVGEAVSLHSYVIGVGKTPVFAVIIAAVGCFQGFQVADSAESVGRHTTISVVQAIFLVIVVDAIFSVVFSRWGF